MEKITPFIHCSVMRSFPSKTRYVYILQYGFRFLRHLKDEAYGTAELHETDLYICG